MKQADPPLSQRWALYSSHIGADGGYMRRWIARHPWGTVRLHHILRSDAGRDFHDHPFDFTSLILTGGYLEHVPGCECGAGEAAVRRLLAAHGMRHGSTPCRYYGPGSIVRRHAEQLHRLELINGPAWTLVASGHYRRMWGFQTPTGWIPYQQYPGEA